MNQYKPDDNIPDYFIFDRKKHNIYTDNSHKYFVAKIHKYNRKNSWNHYIYLQKSFIMAIINIF